MLLRQAQAEAKTLQQLRKGGPEHAQGRIVAEDVSPFFGKDSFPGQESWQEMDFQEPRQRLPKNWCESFQVYAWQQHIFLHPTSNTCEAQISCTAFKTLLPVAQLDTAGATFFVTMVIESEGILGGGGAGRPKKTFGKFRLRAARLGRIEVSGGT